MNPYISGVIELAKKNTSCESAYCLAKKVGISQPAIQQWINRGTLPSGVPAMRLANAAGIDAGAFVLWSAARQMERRFPNASSEALNTLQRSLKKTDLAPRGSGLNPWG